MLCEEYGFKLAQDFYWWNPAKLPTPAEWVTVRRIRAKDAINKIWWLSKTRVAEGEQQACSTALQRKHEGSCWPKATTPSLRPSGHDISDQFQIDNGASHSSQPACHRKHREQQPISPILPRRGIYKPHPARFPVELPEFFVRMLTDEGDLVVRSLCRKLRDRRNL